MSCSWTGVSMTCRAGSECTSTRILPGMTSSQAGTIFSPASARDDERCHLDGLRADLDDVAARDAVGRDVDLVPVDRDVAVADQLARHVARLGEAGAVDDVIESALEDLQQDLTGLALLA